ncbi:hypothetical protein [Amycolatopsis sp. cmx-4-54]|uniref:hypothetical protein n=1 Tax=Amycolatopsis sp. cmx-4-54 TaxID=2790936 RepID=UPI00397E1B4C
MPFRIDQSGSGCPTDSSTINTGCSTNPADAEQFTAGLVDVERRLTDRIADLIARRDTLRQLADGDRLLLPDRALAILERLTDLGFDPDYVASQREALVLARALAPELFDIFLTQLEQRLDDREFVDLTVTDHAICHLTTLSVTATA